MGARVELRGRVALVTGGTAGIGREVCLGLAREGMRVVAASNEGAALPEVVAGIEAAGGQGHGLEVDLSDPAQSVALFARAEACAGPVHLLVNNAGVGLQGTVLQASEADLRRLMEINLFAVCLLSREALGRMSARREGHILNVTSASARRGLPRASAYTASKAAVHAFTQALRAEARPLGVTVSEILPISVATAFFERARNLEARDYRPRGLVQTPRQVADRIVACARRPRAEETTSLLAHVALSIQAAFPNLVEPLLARLAER